MGKTITSTNDTTIKKRRRIFVEILILGILYITYTTIRNHNEASKERAFSNALKIIWLEKKLFIYVELPIHHFFLQHEWVIIISNYYYGSFHFIVTIFALVYVFIKDPDRYPVVRTSIVSMTLLALAGFITYPLMPPRLLPTKYGFIDTLNKFPTIWSFNQEGFAKISNQFAAMPSLHIGWSTWCLFVLYPYTNKYWQKILLILYPCMTLFVIIVTSNHFILDAVGGLAVFFCGYAIAYGIKMIQLSKYKSNLITETDKEISSQLKSIK